jgi:hypothetical protein
MLADANIAQANVSKAKPPAPRPAIGHTHAGRQPQRGASKRRRRRWRRGIPVAEGRRRGGGPHAVVAGEGSGPGGGVGGGGALGRAAASGTEMSVGDREGGRRRGRACRWWETALRA